MDLQNTDNSIDDHVDKEIYDCLNPDNPKSFFLFAGAGSGKTKSLVNVLTDFKNSHGKRFRLNRQKVAIITYTNAACDEIVHRLDYDPIFTVSTIHSFAWELIKTFTYDIKDWLTENLQIEISKLETEQSKSRNLQNKTSQERASKIESKTKRLQNLENVTQFTYNPNSNIFSKDSLNHSEVISIAADFIRTKPLMQDLLSCRFPVLLIDESQDTKKELIDAFFELQKIKKTSFSLGLFGDTMQRIYSDGKENLGIGLPEDWITPAKKMNHRSNKRIIKLINDIRQEVDNHRQIPRFEKAEGKVRLFISSRNANKQKVEQSILNKMAVLAKDELWCDQDKVKTLILEHHMAASRMGFYGFFEPLYKVDKLSTGLLDGSLPGLNLFTKMVLPLIEAKESANDFAIANVVKSYSEFLRKDEIFKNDNQVQNVNDAKIALSKLLSLWDNDADPMLKDILKNISDSGLFPIPDNFKSIIKGSNFELDEEEETIEDEIINAWDAALSNPFSQLRNYQYYLSENSKFGTQQGVKGLEYSRVMVIIDDEESRGFLFSYDKLFGSKAMSQTDFSNIDEGKETGIDRTRRLFYVACSRAKDSLAIVAYTDAPEVVKASAIKYGWFLDDEIEIVNY